MSSGAAIASVPARVLWMDDEPTPIKFYRRHISEESRCFAIDLEVVESIQEARTLLRSGEFSALVVDLKMDKHDFNENGAEFLLEINRAYKYLPTFVFSNYLDDPRYRNFLQDCNPILAVSKAAGFSRPLSETEFFRTLNRRATCYLAVKDLYPEAIEFGDYIDNPLHFDREINAHWQKHGPWISREIQAKHYAWCVICGDNLVAGSPDPREYPSEEVLVKIGEEYNLVPFAYGAVRAPEELHGLLGQGGWHQTVYPLDFYPTLRLRIGNNEIEEDFDTGAPRTHVSDDLVVRGRFDFLRDSSGEHLGEPYSFFTKPVTVSLVDPTGNMETSELLVNVVKDWYQTAFVSVNANRQCLLGRDLLGVFDVELVLNSKTRTTTIRLLRAV